MRTTKAQRIMVEIHKLQEELQYHQTICKHKKATKKHGASTGGYDPNDDYYWTEFKCPTCLKQWTVEGSL